MSIKVEHESDIDQQLQEAFHDMRQPVAATLALAAAALTEPDLPGAARDRLKQIIEQAEWLADMIHGCLVARGQAEPDEIDGPGFGKIPGGAGLGLSAVARNVVMYGGRMECSGGMRGGARVSLWLP